jgi:membrane protein required for colicin V production
MHQTDIALLLLLALFAARGLWRGFFRESFGFFAVVIGIAAAVQFGDVAAARLGTLVDAPEAARAGIAFMAVFLAVHTAFTGLGALLDRVASTILFQGVNRLAGAAFALGKGSVVLAFVLLFVHVFPTAVPGAEQQIMGSHLARPLIAFAATVVRAATPRGEPAGPPPRS